MTAAVSAWGVTSAHDLPLTRKGSGRTPCARGRPARYCYVSSQAYQKAPQGPQEGQEATEAGDTVEGADRPRLAGLERLPVLLGAWSSEWSVAALNWV